MPDIDPNSVIIQHGITFDQPKIDKALALLDHLDAIEEAVDPDPEKIIPFSDDVPRHSFIVSNPTIESQISFYHGLGQNLQINFNPKWKRGNMGQITLLDCANNPDIECLRPADPGASSLTAITRIKQVSRAIRPYIERAANAHLFEEPESEELLAMRRLQQAVAASSFAKSGQRTTVLLPSPFAKPAMYQGLSTERVELEPETEAERQIFDLPPSIMVVMINDHNPSIYVAPISFTIEPGAYDSLQLMRMIAGGNQ